MSGLHWDEGRLAQRIFANLASGSNLLQGYEQFDVFTDMEYLNDFGTYLEAYKLFPYLAAQYPDAVFILNTRNREAWIRSRLTHGKNLSYARRAMVHYDITSINELTHLWRAEWEQHHRNVTEFFGDNKFRLIVCRIETDLPHILDKALPECKLNSGYYSVKGRKKPSNYYSLLHSSMRTARRIRNVVRAGLCSAPHVPPRAAAWNLARVGEPSFYRTIMLRRRIEQALAPVVAARLFVACPEEAFVRGVVRQSARRACNSSCFGRLGRSSRCSPARTRTCSERELREGSSHSAQRWDALSSPSSQMGVFTRRLSAPLGVLR